MGACDFSTCDNFNGSRSKLTRSAREVGREHLVSAGRQCVSFSSPSCTTYQRVKSTDCEQQTCLCYTPITSSSKGLFSTARDHCSPLSCDGRRSRVLSIQHPNPRMPELRFWLSCSAIDSRVFRHLQDMRLLYLPSGTLECETGKLDSCDRDRLRVDITDIVGQDPYPMLILSPAAPPAIGFSAQKTYPSGSICPGDSEFSATVPAAAHFLRLSCVQQHS